MRLRWLVVAGGAAVAAVVVASSMAEISGYRGRPPVDRIASLFGVVILLVLALRCGVFFFRLVRSHEEQPLSACGVAIKRGAGPFFVTLCGAAITVTFLVVMGWIKAMLPAFTSFWADAPLSAIDGALPRIPPIGALTIPYASWQMAHLGTILWVLHWREGRQKEQAIVSFFIVWSLGMTLAYLLPSAGPLFTGRAHPVDAATALETRMLWANYKSAGASIGSGISAFPSMHVAIAMWIALVLRERGLLWIGATFVIAISLGAISLGWHYWTDVIGGLCISVIAWAASAQVVAQTVFDVDPAEVSVPALAGAPEL